MAEGYARSRPPVHPHVVKLIAQHLAPAAPYAYALDIGCGAGLSTAPLLPLARCVVGIEPSLAMLRWARRHIPAALFASGSSEALPVQTASMDLITAAGSLNWSDLDLVFPEIRRVLKPSGRFVLYDFGQGREMDGSSRLAQWEDEFKRRYPSPPAITIVPSVLNTAPYGLKLEDEEPFSIGITLAEDFYLEYALTETNVAAAIHNGADMTAIRDWCATTLRDVFQGAPQTVTFNGFVAYYSAASA